MLLPHQKVPKVPVTTRLKVVPAGNVNPRKRIPPSHLTNTSPRRRSKTIIFPRSEVLARPMTVPAMISGKTPSSSPKPRRTNLTLLARPGMLPNPAARRKKRSSLKSMDALIVLNAEVVAVAVVVIGAVAEAAIVVVAVVALVDPVPARATLQTSMSLMKRLSLPSPKR